MKLFAFKKDATDQSELKRLRQRLDEEKKENMRIKKSYERSCDQIKKEFEAIKSEMELTWIEQKRETDKYVLGLKADFERRLIHE